jgi:hypothetical protein
MADPVEQIGAAADAAATETVRVPRDLLAHFRQTYDTREKLLDWMLAAGVVAALLWAFRDELWSSWGWGEAGVNAGRAGPSQPTQDTSGLACSSATRPDLYNYNAPFSRYLRYAIGPAGTAPPGNPSLPPAFI